MNPEDVLRLVDSIHRDRGINKEIIFEAIEQALASAARKRFHEPRADGTEGEIEVKIDRFSGEIDAREDEKPLNVYQFGRIAARTAYQIITQRIREAERDVIFDDYESKVDTLVTGSVQRFEKGSIIVNLGRTEAILPRTEQVFNEMYRTGDRVRAYVLSVKKRGQKVYIILSRTHPNLVKELFLLEVPEISDRIVEIQGLVREPGHRTKIAVTSRDIKVDPIGACVGVRGSRIRNIVDELNGEKIDIVRWNESDEIFICNALSPAEITQVDLEHETRRCRVVVPEDQVSLAIGKKGQNVRLSARLTSWQIDICDEEEAKRERQRDREELNKLVEHFDFLDQGQVDTLLMTGVSSLQVLLARGVEGLLGKAGLNDEEQVRELIEYVTVRAQEVRQERAAEAERQRLADQAARREREAEAAKAAEAPAEEPADQEAADAPASNDTETPEAQADSTDAPSSGESEASEASASSDTETPEAQADSADASSSTELEAPEAPADPEGIEKSQGVASASTTDSSGTAETTGADET